MSIMTFSSVNTRIDAMNIALMVLAAGLALIVPLPLFLFAYAVLGPLHYLTEISWLHDRSYFISEKESIPKFLIFGIVASLLILTNRMPDWFLPAAVYTLFGWALILTSSKAGIKRDYSVVFLFVTTVLFILFEPPMYILLFAIFIPTLIHVFGFTAAFMLSGALKSRSAVGFLGFFTLLATAIVLLNYVPEYSNRFFSAYVIESYQPFIFINEAFMNLFFGQGVARLTVESAAVSETGRAVMQFIAFAYTYHYLNWFSKSQIIGWNRTSSMRRNLIVGSWIAAVAVYAYDYRIGVQVLFFLSFMHVLLEFPLNHRSFVDISRRLLPLSPS